MGFGQKILNWMDSKTLESMERKSAKRSEAEELDDQIKYLEMQKRRMMGSIGSREYSKIEDQLSKLKKKRESLPKIKSK